MPPIQGANADTLPPRSGLCCTRPYGCAGGHPRHPTACRDGFAPWRAQQAPPHAASGGGPAAARARQRRQERHHPRRLDHGGQCPCGFRAQHSTDAATVGVQGAWGSAVRTGGQGAAVVRSVNCFLHHSRVWLHPRGAVGRRSLERGTPEEEEGKGTKRKKGCGALNRRGKEAVCRDGIGPHLPASAPLLLLL